MIPNKEGPWFASVHMPSGYTTIVCDVCRMTDGKLIAFIPGERRKYILTDNLFMNWIGPAALKVDTDKISDGALEKAALLCERVRCRIWSPSECAFQIREQLKKG